MKELILKQVNILKQYWY